MLLSVKCKYALVVKVSCSCKHSICMQLQCYRYNIMFLLQLCLFNSMNDSVLMACKLKLFVFHYNTIDA